MNRLSLASALALALLGSAAVQAQSLKGLTVRIGATHIAPDVTSGDLTAPSFAGTKADVGAASQLGGGLNWALNDRWSIDIPLVVAGFKHDINGDGAIAGVGKIGEVQALPATALVQYRLLPAGAKLSPYLGAGITYAKFYKARSTAALTALTGGTPANPTTLSVESKWAMTVQAGASLQLAPKWSLDASVTKTPLKTRTILSTGQTLDAKLDPMSISVGVGYQF
jgi:outer membrane protein